jgi:hypothetical protein
VTGKSWSWHTRAEWPWRRAVHVLEYIEKMGGQDSEKVVLERREKKAYTYRRRKNKKTSHPSIHRFRKKERKKEKISSFTALKTMIILKIEIIKTRREAHSTLGSSTHPLSASQTLIVVSNAPLTTLTPSNATE